MKETKTEKKSAVKQIGMAVFIAIAVLLALFFFYTENYYHAGSAAYASLASTESVDVIMEDWGFCFDGPGTEDILIFYPGGKVEETAYAPLMQELAEQGLDCCLVRMPFRLAVFDAKRAEFILAEKIADPASPEGAETKRPRSELYDRAFIGGHSLGGAMAASFAADHPELLDGVILLAAYSTKELPEDLPVLSIYGTEDGVLNREKYETYRANLPDLQEIVLEGGNHAQFGDYGKQRGDGEASISAEEQLDQTAQAILEW